MTQNINNAKVQAQQSMIMEQEIQRQTKIENQHFLQTKALQEQNSKFDLMQKNIELINQELQASKIQSKTSVVIMKWTLIVSILALLATILK